MIDRRPVTTRSAKTCRFVMTLLAFTCPAFTLVAQNVGQRDATFVGAIQTPGVTPNNNPTGERTTPFLPTMDAGTYAAFKNQAGAMPSGTKPGAGLGASLSQPSRNTVNLGFTGVDRFGAADQGFVYTPPDINTASGQGQIVEVTNDHYTCFDTSGNVLQDTPASAFFGYTRQLFTDPRVVYDSLWNRFIVTEVAFPENANTMIFFLAASLSSDCTAGYYVYSLNMPIAAGDFYDYPQVGYDQDAILTTFNVFNGNPFKYGEIDFWAKARVYNGLGVSVPFINGYGGTLTPNVSRDNSGTTIVLQNVAGTNLVNLIKLTNTAKSNPTTSTVTVTTPETCGVPRSANQPGTTAKLDTLDGRFQAPGTQNAPFVWNVQTCGISGFPIPRVLQINFSTNTVTQRDFVFASGSSDDFNPSLAVNDRGDVLMNWSSTDVGVNAGMLSASRSSGGAFSSNGQCFQSGTFSTAFRWGDTSGTSVDFTDPTQQTWWTSNEFVEDASNWGTQVCQITRP